MTDPEADRTPIPSRIGHYLVEREIGRGAMGVVYLGRDTRLDRAVAIKALPDALTAKTTLLDRLIREARVLAALNHPNIATIYAVEELAGQPCLILEHIPGESLAERLRRGALPLEEALQVMERVAAALAAAHHIGIVHRDLKPANIRVGPGGVVKLLDFGLARAALDALASAEIRDSEETQDGIAVGTPGYMSPELLQGDDAGPASDIWAFGCVLYECLVARPAWPGKTARERFDAILTRSLDLGPLEGWLPERVRNLLVACLRKNPAERPTSIAVARAELAHAWTEVSSGTSSEIIPLQPPEPGNLPREVSRFVGRERELGDLERMLAETQLLTLTGVGGCGKTRLALRLARRLPARPQHGAWLIELGSIVDPEQVAREVARALRVPEEPGRSIEEAVVAWLEGREALLVLDNCEHLLAPVAHLVAALLARCERLQVVVTSREPLGIAGETTWVVKSLEPADAVELFLERARAAVPGFSPHGVASERIAEICRRLDGIPLALELAAARLRSLSAEQIAERLDDRFRLLTGGRRAALERHRTLRALIDWSYELLGPGERVVLRRLAVFPGSFTPEAAEAVCGDGDVAPDEVLERLLNLSDKSLVSSEPAGAARRFNQLETIRQYGHDRLGESGEAEAVRARQFEYFLALARDADAELNGAGQAAALARLEADQHNLRAALDWAHHKDADSALRLAGALWRFWEMCGQFAEGRYHLEEALAHATAPCETRARALNGLGAIAHRQGDYSDARRRFEEALEIRRALGDRMAIAASLNNVASAASGQGDLVAAHALNAESLAIKRELGDPWGVALSLSNLGGIAIDRCDHEGARRYLEESLAILRKLGDRRGIAMALHNLGQLELELGHGQGARDRFEECIANLDSTHDRWGIANSRLPLADLAALDGDAAGAAGLYREVLPVFRELGDRAGAAQALEGLAALALTAGRARRGARLLAASAQLREAAGVPARPSQRRRSSELATRAEAALGSEAYQRSQGRGRALSLDQAVAYALDTRAPR